MRAIANPGMVARFSAAIASGLFLLCTATEAPAAISYVQTIGTNSTQLTSTTLSATIGLTGVSAGNSIVVSFAMTGTSGTVTCADSAGNSYSINADITNATTKTSRLVIFSAHNVSALTSGNSITVTSPSTDTRVISAFEFSGLAKTGAVDKTQTATGNSATPSSGSTATTTQNSELLFGASAMSYSSNDVYTPGTGYTLIGRVGTIGNVPYDMTANPEYRIVSTTGSYLADGTNDKIHPWAAAIVTYKEITFTVSGNVFEDVNYGGGAGRTKAASSGVGLSSARVELYDSGGNYVTATTTDGSGNYSFPGLTAGNYTTRVVNSSVPGSRTGYISSLVPVQTYRTTATTGTPTAVTDRVGGEIPTAVAAGNGAPGTIMNTTTGVFTAGISGQAQSFTTVALSASNVTGVDFGFNFDTIVNVNNTGQGSLRQLLTNANTLGGDASLAQSGLVAGKENAVFMISNGTSAPGLRAANNYFVGGIATIAPASALPTISSPLVLDAQKQPGWTSPPIIELNGTSAGGSASGITITGGNSILKGFVINRFLANGIDITTGGGNTIAGCYVGTTAAGTAAAANANYGINISDSSNNLIGGTTTSARNVVSCNTLRGLTIGGAASTGNTVKGNYFGTNASGSSGIGTQAAGVTIDSAATGNSVGGTTSADRNVISGNTAYGVRIAGVGTSSNVVQGNFIGTDAAGTGAVANTNGINTDNNATNNTIGGTVAGAGNLIAFNTNRGVRLVSAGDQGIGILGNQIYGSGNIGIDLGNDGVTTNNGTKNAGLPNLDMDYPVFTSASVSGSTLTVAGYVGNAPSQSTFASARVEIFKSDNDATGFGEGQIYYGFLTADANGNFSGSVTAGGLAGGDKITGTATDASNNTSEFGPNVTVGNAISGNVFEDVNYGGGAGRNKATSSGLGQASARVELYDASGNYVSATTTDGSGNYSFVSLTPANYTIRVVNSTVTSSRTGYVPGLLPVQTFRTNGLTGTVGTDDPNRVGGENPAVAGAGAGGPGTVMNTSTGVFTAGITGQAQSITTVTLGAASVTGIDFGFNFDTIVNLNDSSQGSLRQVITNANTLTGDASLAQSGLVAGKENAVFMISNGTSAPGLRAANNYFVGGVATIATASVLPTITGVLVLDAQKQPGWSSSPVVVLNGSGAGAGVSGFTITAGSSTVKGLTIRSFTGDGILLQTAGSNTIAGNWIGLDAAGSSAAGNQNGVSISATTNNTIGGTTATTRNVISGNSSNGTLVSGAGATGNGITGNYIGTNAAGTVAIANSAAGVHLFQSASNTVGGTAAGSGNVLSGNGTNGVLITSSGASNTIQGNLIGRNAGDSGTIANTGAAISIASGCNNNAIGGTAAGAANTISGNGARGVVVLGGTGNAIRRNTIYANTSLGIDLGGNNVTPNDGVTNGSAANSGIDYPIFTSASLSGSTMTVAGYVGSAAGQPAFANAIIEIFKVDDSPADQNGEIVSGDGKNVAHGEGKTYLGTINADASGNFSGSLTVSGVTGSDQITATATDASGNTSEFGANTNFSVPGLITGRVFEDVNYGGGAGRDNASATGVGLQNTRVELYSIAGLFITSTTTDSTGTYTFPSLSASTYTVRVVNSTVPSSRSGYVAGLLPVQTFRTNGLTGTVGTADPNRVGGENPAVADAGAGSTGTIMNTTTGVFTTGISGQAQSITTLPLGSTGLTAIDFGFNFDTIVNVNGTAQGSLRQMITNANTLGGDASLAQSGLVAAKENAVFMISNGTSSPGLRASLNYFVGGVATIAPASSLPTISSPLVLDAQKQPGWTSAPIIELNGAGAPGNGLLISAGASTVRGVVVNRFSNVGIYLTTSGNNLIAGNYVGTNAAATAALANGSGIEIDNSPNNTIGGNAATDTNIISGNTGKGVSLDNAGSTGNVIKGNRIGTNAAGTAAIAGSVGVQLTDAPNNTIGGSAAGAGNVISGHSSQGVFLTGSTTGALVQGNLIGTNAAGSAALANNFGVFIAGPAGNTIGGSTAGARNIISGNSIGLDIQGGSASNNVIAGNYIGTNAAGSAALANTSAGIILSDAPNNAIGGTAAGAGNVISGNIGNGLALAGAGTTGTLVQGNRIGTDASGIASVGNSGAGISVGSGGNHDNTIGGAAAGAPNTIAFNGGIGVKVNAGVSQLISRNSIYGNGALGIDLNADGVTPNDGAKNGAQPNSGMDTPVFTSVVLSGGTLNVVGYVGSAPGQATFAGAVVEIFKSDRDASGFGEGPLYVASLTTDGGGNFSGSFSAGTLSAADAITGTATDGANNTSEFGPNFNLAPGVTGTVYLDANHNSIFDSGEAGTGLTLFAKIFLSSAPSGPALQAVVVNTTTGAYIFSAVSPGTYTIIIDNNNTLADVTPTLPAGYAGTEQPNQTRSNVAVSAAPLPNQNFGLINALPLSGRVFVDTATGGGTANDGILNGGEIGLAAVTVKLTDATGATTYDSATTDGAGNYVLFVPQTLANGTQLKVVETNLASYVSTGASLGNTSGTYNRATDTIAFALASNTTYTNVNFGDVPDIVFTTDNAQSALPGSTIVYAHSFTAGSVGQVTFSSARVSTPPNNNWSSTLYRDVNNNGKVDAGDTIISAPIALNTGEKIQILVQQVIPVNAPLNARDTLTITASHSYTNANPALASSALHTDVTTVGNPTTAGLALAKSVDKATVLPGDTLTYTVAYTNNSSDALSNVIISDSTPAFTTFLSAGNGPLPDNLTGVVITKPAVGATGALRWTFTGTLAPASNGTVTFQVKVNQ